MVRNSVGNAICGRKIGSNSNAICCRGDANYSIEFREGVDESRIKEAQDMKVLIEIIVGNLKKFEI